MGMTLALHLGVRSARSDSDRWRTRVGPARPPKKPSGPPVPPSSHHTSVVVATTGRALVPRDPVACDNVRVEPPRRSSTTQFGGTGDAGEMADHPQVAGQGPVYAAQA